MYQLETHIKGGWECTIHPDGSQSVRRLKAKTSGFHFFWHMPVLDDCIMPEYVRHMVYAQRDAHRHFFRLGRAWRLGAWCAFKTGKSIKISWYGYDWAEKSGKWYRPKSNLWIRSKV